MKTLNNTTVIPSNLANRIFILACNNANNNSESYEIYQFMKLNRLEYWKTNYHFAFYGNNERPNSIFDIFYNSFSVN